MSDSFAHSTEANLRRRICTIGILLFLASLVLPAVKHGGTISGFECLQFSAVIAFQPMHQLNQMVIMSRAATIAHAACVGAIFLAYGKRRRNAVSFIFTVPILSVCLLFLVRPDFGIETRYIGYFVWLFSMSLIAASQHIANQNG